MSSSRPMKGLTYFAPAFAARIAWFAEKMRVVLIFTPSDERALIAFSPSVVIWIFTTTFLCSFASCRPCLIISSPAVVVTSNEIGPSTRARMSWITSDHLRPVFATNVGFVVTPSRTPQEAASRISSMFAVSRKILTMDAASAEGRGTMVAAIVVLGIICLLHLAYLYVFAFLIGILTVFFDVAYQAYLPAIVDRGQLVDANSKLETSNTFASTFGPGIAGPVIDLFRAPFAMLFDAASFAVSAASLGAIRRRETIAARPPGESILSQIREGLHVVLRERRLRHIAVCTGWSNFFSSAVFSALFLLFLKYLGFTATTLGLLFGLSSVGGILGAIFSVRIAKRIGVGPAIILGAVIFGLPPLPLPFVTSSIALPAIAILLGISFFGNLLYNINQVSFRQAIVPVALQGRLNATMRTIVWGTLPLGALFGGFLGSLVGLRPAILVLFLAGGVSFLFVLFSQVRQIVEMPESAP